MPIPTLDLDTRRYPDLVDEARSLIPRRAPAWTDHNASDPGITLVELLAYLTEQVVYRANRTTDRQRRAFLALVGATPAPPRAARVVLALTPGPTGDGAVVPAGVVVAAGDVPFRTLAPLTLTATALAAVQVFDGTDFADRTAVARAGAPLAAFRDDPSADAALLLGFDGPLAAGRELALHLAVEGSLDDGATGPHHGMRVAWELFDGSDWQAVDADDATRSLTRDGAVRLRPVIAPPAAVIGEVPDALHWLRCRLAAGAPDAPPRVAGIAVNAVAARQAAPLRQTFAIAAGTPPPAPAPVPGATAALHVALDDAGTIVSFTAAGDAAPAVLVLGYAAATATTPGTLTLACAQVGRGSGAPGAALALPAAPITDGRLSLWSLEADGAHGWTVAPDLDAATAADRTATLDAATGTLTFGDGLHGRVAAAGAPLLAEAEHTCAADGNVAQTTSWRLTGADDALNAALLGGDPAVLAARIAAIANPWPATGGADAETLADAAARAAAALWAHERLVGLADARGVSTLDAVARADVLALDAPARAVTLLDFERLALAVPGTRVARARAFAGVDGAHPGLAAPGTVTVVVVAGQPVARPLPSPGLLAAVRRHLAARKTLGTRLVVCGPRYVEVDVHATLAVRTHASADRVAADARDAVAAHLDPLRRPFGRDVYRSELLSLLDAVDGVDHVTALVLTSGGCGDVCVPPTGLAVAGTIAIEVAG